MSEAFITGCIGDASYKRDLGWVEDIFEHIGDCNHFFRPTLKDLIVYEDTECEGRLVDNLYSCWVLRVNQRCPRCHGR